MSGSQLEVCQLGLTMCLSLSIRLIILIPLVAKGYPVSGESEPQFTSTFPTLALLMSHQQKQIRQLSPDLRGKEIDSGSLLTGKKSYCKEACINQGSLETDPEIFRAHQQARNSDRLLCYGLKGILFWETFCSKAFIQLAKTHPYYEGSSVLFKVN